MIRLNINVPPHAVGDVLSPALVAVLGDTFVQELVDAGQATRLAEDASTDPVDLVLGEVVELEDQIDAALGRRARILVLAEGLGNEGRERVDAALGTASRVRPELFGLADLVSGDEVKRLNATLEGLDRVASEQSSEIAGLQRQAEDDATTIADLKAQLRAEGATIERLQAALDAATAASTDTPPPPADASGDTGEASASSVDPAATAPVKPAAKSGGTAKAKSGS